LSTAPPDHEAREALARFRFVPRFKGLAYAAMGLGLAMIALAILFSLGGASAAFAWGCGVAGLALGALYLASPAWRIEVLTDGDGLEVQAGGDRRFRLAWGEVVRVIASPSTRTCLLDGGDPDRSLIVPGPGAHAPYDIADKGRLYEIIVSRVPAERIEEVELLETAAPRIKSGSDPGGAAPGSAPKTT
jgi:hypothetical protein